MKLIISFFLSFFCLCLQAQSSFSDAPSGNQGDFPPNWNLIRGSADIASLNGNKIIYLSNSAVISPKIEGNDYLGNNFTLEFDAFYDELSTIPEHQYYQIRFWNGHGHITFPSGDFSNPLNIQCNGARMSGRLNGQSIDFKNFKNRMNDANNIWRHIKITYNSGSLKVQIDDFTAINTPKVPFDPSMISIGVFNHGHGDNVRAIKNIRLTETKNGPIISTIEIDPKDALEDANILNDIETTDDSSTVEPVELVVKPIKLKVILTDLLCIKKRSHYEKAKYSFNQNVEYEVAGKTKIAIEKIDSGSLGLNHACYIGEQCEFFLNTLATSHPSEEGRSSKYIFRAQTAKKESNIMNALIFEITSDEIKDKSAKFKIKSLLGDLDMSPLDKPKLLYYGYIDVSIFEILEDLLLLKEGKSVLGYSTAFHDPEIMKAQYGLFKTFDSGPNEKLWVRQVGKTLEGPISLGNTNQNDGLRGAAWIKFELLNY
ncbi:hypothetical protein [Seonamhaeicola maritimus]|uniref:hypothetical protein n=1 Tax=Seonamhaeicola maritimus TaxID=2591822 RepID=UPI002493DA8D|nr:hypothetical protein [Seonamhaeicola maritimus]